MQCRTFSHINERGGKSYKDKKSFNTLKEAIFDCKVFNAKPKQIIKLVSYKCVDCCKYHIGRNGKLLTEKYKIKLNFELDELFPNRKKENKSRKIKRVVKREGNATDPKCKGAVFKVVGKIDLSKFQKYKKK